VKNNLIKYNIGGHFLFTGIIVIIMAVILFLVYCGYNDKLKLQAKFNNNNHIAQAHFFGASQNVNNYQIIFQPFPFVPFAGDNSTTLNFSILDNNNSNVDNIYSALVITEKNTGKVVGQIPYRFYEFSDITFRYPFQYVGNYVATLKSRINGDPNYQHIPLIASFEISVTDIHKVIPFGQLMLYYVTPGTIAMTGIVIYLLYRKKE
jgi:hypothetical protein